MTSLLDDLFECHNTLISVKNLAIVGVDDGTLIHTFSTALNGFGKPYNYDILAIDTKNNVLGKYRGIKKTRFVPLPSLEDLHMPHQVDLIYTEKLQFFYNPYGFVKNVNQCLTDGGIFAFSVPSTSSIQKNVFHHYTESHQPFCWTVPSVVYMLASNGFEVAHVRKTNYTDQIDILAYKACEPLNNPSWYEIMEKKLLTKDMEKIVLKKGYLVDLDLVITWIDGRNELLNG